GGRVATMVVPQDVSWGDTHDEDLTAGRDTAGRVEMGSGAVGGVDLIQAPMREPMREPIGKGAGPDDGLLDEIVQMLGAGNQACLFLGGRALRERPVRLAARLASITGARIFAEVLPSRMERGGSIPVVDRLGYLPELAMGQLAGIEYLVLVDTPEPVSFFAYEGVPSSLVPEGCKVVDLASGFDDVEGALIRLEGMLTRQHMEADLVSRVGAPGTETLPVHTLPGETAIEGSRAGGAQAARASVQGKLDSEILGTIFSALLPENVIVVDEGVSEGLFAYLYSANSPRHDWLCLSGGAIGQGLPLSVGAAIACPDRRVIALEADGSSMYTVQALWTQARESLNIVTIILANRSYRLLQIEMQRLGLDQAGPSSMGLTSIAGPPIDFVGLARSMGVDAVSVDDADGFASALESALVAEGPHLIEAVLQ
ncbi:MAG: thiamine pyrophosphate-dependent enzyme, partial [Acidimicrobiales bacterium]